jgi:hypothetical protein
MNLLAAWKKVLLFGLFGAVGCLAGWLLGEPYLLIAEAASPAGSGRAPTLISKPLPPPSEPPPPPSEFQKRLAEAKPGGAGTGDVQISLIWFDENDLDLHCVDPSGFEICWKPNQRLSPRTSGELDVDRNAGCRATTVEPVENIYWAQGKAPQGKYSVYLDFYARCGHGPDESRYKINVLHGTERKEFSGTIRKDGPEAVPMRLIYEFQLQPRIEAWVPSEFEIVQGTSAVLKVPVRREFYAGKIDLKVEGLPAGVTADPLTLQPGQSEGELTLRATDSAPLTKAKIKIVAAGEGVSHSVDPELTVARSAAAFSLWVVISIGLWTALLAVGLCLALLVGQNRYLGKTPFAPGRVPLALVIVGAALAGFVSGSIGQALFFVLFSLGGASVGMVLGWMLLGALLGAGVSFFVPNLDAKKAALAGLGGGLLGAIAFLVIGEVKEWLGRFGGAALLGFCIGLMVAVVEAAFRRAWLEVRFGEREVITVNLGPEPVKVGGDARACAVWARGAAPIALRYWVRDGQVLCEDVPTHREARAADGDTRGVGGVTVIVHTASGPRPTAPVPARPGNPVPLPTAPAPVLSPPPVPPPARAPVPAKRTEPDDDGMSMPFGPPPPPRPSAASILDQDDYRAPARPVPSKPAAPAPAPAGAAAKPAPPAPRPPIPSAPAPKPPAPPQPSAAKGADPDACPSCGRKTAGKPGTRYCMVCDRTF